MVRRARWTLVGLGTWMALIAGGLSFGGLSAAVRDGVLLQGVLLVAAIWAGAALLVGELGWRSATYRLVVHPDGTVQAGTPGRRRSTWVGPADQVRIQGRRNWWTLTRRNWVQELVIVPADGRPAFRSRLPGGDVVPLLTAGDAEHLHQIVTGHHLTGGPSLPTGPASPPAGGASDGPADEATTRAQIGRLAVAIEQEMRRVGLWADGAPPIDPATVTSAFGVGQMPFEQWLQGVFVSRLREVAAGTTAIPPGSQVAVMAIRTWHDPRAARRDVGRLLDLLTEVDRVVNATARRVTDQ
jgi:uncharacterized protein YqcC (DUF446 family)